MTIMLVFRKCFMGILVLLTFASYAKVMAQPDFSSKQRIDSIIVYQDASQQGLYYYVPYGLKLVKDKEGKPDFSFLMMRYTGTKAAGDQGLKRFRSLLKFRMANHSPSPQEIQAVKQTLDPKGIRSIKLKPLPVHNLEARLVYAVPSETPNDTSNVQVLSGGFFENTDEKEKGSFWKERNFTLRLDNHAAQLFWEAFQGKQSILSVGYAFITKGLYAPDHEISYAGTSELLQKMGNTLFSEPDSIKEEKQLTPVIVLAGAMDIQVNTEAWPGLLKKVDINERIPPEYAAVDVYCFDFNNEIRDDLYAKRLEIEAQGVGRNAVNVRVTFRSSQPDIYAHTIHFPYAVRLDQPLRYRITEIFTDGQMQKSEWQEKESWHGILDITSKPDP